MVPGTRFQPVLPDAHPPTDKITSPWSVEIFSTSSPGNVQHEDWRPRSAHILKPYTSSETTPEWLWVQEEPRNQGTRRRVQDRLGAVLSGLGVQGEVRYIGRREDAVPTTGTGKVYQAQQRAVIFVKHPVTASSRDTPWKLAAGDAIGEGDDDLNQESQVISQHGTWANGSTSRHNLGMDGHAQIRLANGRTKDPKGSQETLVRSEDETEAGAQSSCPGRRVNDVEHASCPFVVLTDLGGVARKMVHTYLGGDYHYAEREIRYEKEERHAGRGARFEDYKEGRSEQNIKEMNFGYPRLFALRTG
ncbi:hypothetical protein PAXINDRAFT_99922 [Paxillus involutus ATCC 200175]|uniref:2-oxoglutarate dehydrogenase E1 component/KDG C-terminal domain-containing protein n=1 Tax=Paxillus involutus ATCC 200175 TaxID=664439 RepID=A0A0C9TG52_PAXIN|nr:hypothetical protein PAXINDRAFT_99922 [Paxillus involutus ATCC 200175]